MPILKGFPPSNTISPSVRITEKDYTLLTGTPSTHNIGLVGYASKGIFNQPIKVSDLAGLKVAFGNPHDTVSVPYLLYAAQNALQASDSVYIVRVGDLNTLSPTAAKIAGVSVPAGGQVISVLGTISGPFTFTDDSYFRWSLNGIESDKTLTVPKNSVSNPYGTSYSSTELVEVLNSQLDSTVDGIQFFASGNYVGIKTVWAYGAQAVLEFLGVQKGLVGGAPSSTQNIIGLGNSMSEAIVIGQADRFPNNVYMAAGAWDFTGYDLNPFYVNVVVNGTDNTAIDGIVQTIDCGPVANGGAGLEGSIFTSTTAVVNALNTWATANLPGGFVFEAASANGIIRLKSTIVGKNARVVARGTDTWNNVSGPFLLGLYSGTASSPTYPYAIGGALSGASDDLGSSTYGTLTGPLAPSGDYSLTILADTAGVDGNDTAVLIKNYDGGTFSISVFVSGNLVESYGNLTKDPTSRYYVSDYINSLSNYIRIEDNDAVSAPPANSPDTGLVLSGGTDGIPTDPDLYDDILIGNPATKTGLYAFADPEETEIDLIAVPGQSATDVILKMIDLCQNYRQDCMAIIDPPNDFTPSEIIAWQNGGHPLNKIKLNSDYGALYWPWVKVFDSYNNKDVWAPPSGAVLAAFVLSDSLGGPWLAPAGYTRGRVPGISDTMYKPNLAQRDAMYGNQNAINPIITFPDLGGDFVIWGQKTLQRKPTALDRVNVRRMLFYIEKQIKTVAKQLIFEPNTESTRATFSLLASGILADVKNKQGIYDYFIKCDSELNTADVIDRNELRARIGVQPTRAIEFVFIEFSLHRTGSFTQNTDY
jgi:hypothetical protein